MRKTYLVCVVTVLCACGSESGSAGGDAGAADAHTNDAAQMGGSETPFAQLRPEVVNQSFTVVAKSLFYSTCPPCMPGSGTMCSCSPLMGFLGDPDTEYPSYESAVQGALLLAENGARVTCPEGTVPRGCPGWAHEGKYRVTGTLEYLVVSGKPTKVLLFNVTGKTAL